MTLPKRLRRRFRKEAADLVSANVAISDVRLPDVLARVIELEASTAAEHGGRPDIGRLAAARSAMYDYLGPAVRTVVAHRESKIIACGVDMIDSQTYFGLSYGCDYTVPDRATAYQCLCFLEPLRYAADHGLAEVRLGFEAFAPKLIRGARLEGRDTWVWLSNGDMHQALAHLLTFLTSRTASYIEQLPVHQL